MFQEKSLLERLAAPRLAATRTLSEDTGELVDSIIRHLRRMLNSRSGHAAAQMDYGVPDPTEVVHSFPDAIRVVSGAIRMLIEKYEPRLASVEVMHVESEDDKFTLRFQISAQLATTKERPRVCFDTQMDAAGRIEVRS